ncbi:MAG: single-stranded DNA-binding protein [Saprospiraceae bacterium]|nr:MAG: single-strand binding protein [Bacteroidetes bacterium OLB9]MCO6464096.1 single-stranded DNA-binding protein [Saprospiraceae bacterium]MCZ2336658.1 single-stranded DNA-binding protein [Chitinophagales bacterium]
MVNKVILIGNLGKDPDIRTLENGTKVGSFTLATNENYKDKNDTWQTITEWHNIVVWRGLAEKVERELKKGSLVYVEGKLTHRRYQDKEGIERSTTEIVASTLNLLEKRERAGVGSNVDPEKKVDTKDSAPESDLPF